MMLMGSRIMKKLALIILLNILLVATASGQEGDVNVERLTIKPDLEISSGIVIKRIELIDDNYGHGTVIIITNDDKQYKKKVEAGHGYYYEMLSGPLKRLEKKNRRK